ncbi:hypothetical protein BDB01DRAFT_804803 [Pilobolus umbonatus]|nr:hypothetical protein BDB01DRAFT_804803 [Pilobolus umbonatus]
MNKQRHPNLPSISTLLSLPSPPSPPRIIVEEEHEPPAFQLSPASPRESNLQYSPMLSPIEPYSISHPPSPLPSPSLLALPTGNIPLPPLQGDDPPRRLRQPSILSNASTVDDSEEDRPPPPSTQIILSESGQPILKRRRGRPPSMREPALEGGWTFLTPTVWDVSNPQQQALSTQRQINKTPMDSMMNGSMAAFTSSNMDMVLQMPRKKRGRKPKTHIVGNSCFVWKDITAARRSTKPKQRQSITFRRLEQAPTDAIV